MISWLVKTFINDSENVSVPNVKKAYAALSSIVGIVLNLFLCTAKIMIGLFGNSIAISADGFNNLSDAGTSFISFLGFRIARYPGGTVHPFGHGRIEWIMSIFTSVAVMLMGLKLAAVSVIAIRNPEKPIFGATMIVVLVLSVLVKFYMYVYNSRFAKITDSSTLKATAADCISDTFATLAVLASTIISHLTIWTVDGYCGVLVSAFIMLAGIKSLWEVLGRIMGKAAEQTITDELLNHIKAYSEICAVQNLMIHDYGFGYFVVSVRVEGYRKDDRQLDLAVSGITYALYQKYQCDCFIQIDYLIDNDMISEKVTNQVDSILHKYNGKISMENLRLLEHGTGIHIAFDMLYPADMQKYVEEIRKMIENEIEQDSPGYHTMIKDIIRREHLSLHR